MRLILEGYVGNCPVCKEGAEHLTDEVEDGKHMSTYVCNPCGLMVTFITPDDGKEYHEYSRIDIEIETSAFRQRFDLDNESEAGHE